jgi:hypothetical protein
MTCEIPLYRCENTLRRFTSPSPPLSCRGGFPYPSRLHPLRVVYLHDPVRLTEVCHAASGPVPPGCPRAVYPTQSCPAAAVDPPPPRSTAPVAAVFLVEPFRATTRRRWSRRLHRSRTSLFVTRRFAQTSLFWTRRLSLAVPALAVSLSQPCRPPLSAVCLSTAILSSPRRLARTYLAEEVCPATLCPASPRRFISSLPSRPWRLVMPPALCPSWRRTVPDQINLYHGSSPRLIELPRVVHLYPAGPSGLAGSFSLEGIVYE